MLSKKNLNNFLYLLLRIVLTSFCVETPFFLCCTVIYRNAVSWIVLNLFVEMPKAVRGVYEFACKVLVR